jgi:CubicO group peptidase (beta-lactamase class C family)
MRRACRASVSRYRARFAAVSTGLVMVVAVVGCGQPAVDAHAPLDEFRAHLDASVPRLMRAYDVPGVAIALVREGRVAATAAYGFADRDRGLRLSVDAVFHTGSISKSVSAWGIMRLVEQGLIDLDDPLSQHLTGWEIPASAHSGPAITLRHALSHTAGVALGPIGNAYPPDGVLPSLGETLTRDLRVVREPGSGFRYSNPGFDLVELVVEQVTDRPFSLFMDDEVLRPLGMHDASFAWREEMRSRIPSGYDLGGAPVAPYVYATKASGGLFATVNDVARFVAASMTGPTSQGRAVLAEASARAVVAPQVAIPGMFGVVADAYALGHFVEELGDGSRAVWHGGQGHGWMTHFHAVPETGGGIVILTNSQRSWPLMARVLSDWAAWSGIGAVKFARISYGVAVMWALTAVLLLASAWLALRLARGARSGRLRLAPLAEGARPRRLVQALFGIGVIAALAWSAAQPYLTVTSVFPGVVQWVFWSSLLLAGVVTMAAAFASPGPGTAERSRVQTNTRGH